MMLGQKTSGGKGKTDGGGCGRRERIGGRAVGKGGQARA